jgi:hypothetical protein
MAKKSKAKTSAAIDWNDLPKEHLETEVPVIEVGREAAPTTLFGKVRVFFRGAKTMIIGGLLLGVSAIAIFDPDTLPLDAFFSIFISDEAVVAKAVGATTLIFTTLRLISPGLAVGLRWAWKRNTAKEA